MMTVDPQAISSGYVVFARPDGSRDQSGIGPFVGVVEDVLTVDGLHYVHVRGGLQNVNELFLPLAEVRLTCSQQVHLQLAVEDLLGQAWQLPLGAAAARPSGFWG
jgi:hypothetical protein